MSDNERRIDNPLYAGMSLKDLLESADLFDFGWRDLKGTEGVMEYMWMLEHERMRRERIFRDRLDPLQISDEHLLRYYRMPRNEILELCEEIGPEIARHTRRTNSIPVSTQVLVALRFYASGSFQSVVSDTVGLSQASTSRIINDVTNILFNKAKREIKMPHDPESIMRTKHEFYAMHGFPSVIGAIDCTHIPIKAPMNAISYLNRKRRYTLNVQVVVNAKMEILSFCARFPGSVHDSHIWRHSVLHRQFVDGRFANSLLLGDSGYPLEPFMMVPISQPTTAGERAYNHSHRSTRVVVEQAFGVLKSRFRCLHESGGSLQYRRDKCSKITIACMLLHNLCIQRRIPLEEPLLNNEDPPADAYRGDERTGVARRRNLIENVFS